MATAKAHDRYGFPVADPASLAQWEQSLARQQLYEAVEAFGGWFPYLMGRALRIGAPPPPVCEMASYLGIWRPHPGGKPSGGGRWSQYWFTTGPEGLEYHSRRRPLGRGRHPWLRLHRPNLDSPDESPTHTPRLTEPRLQGTIPWATIQKVELRASKVAVGTGLASHADTHYFGLLVVAKAGAAPEMVVLRAGSLRVRQEWVRCLERQILALHLHAEGEGEGDAGGEAPDSAQTTLQRTLNPRLDRNQQVPAGKYHDYLRRIADSAKDSQILLDLPRTVPNHQHQPFLIPKLSRVLHAYTVRGRSVGYCQGMNFIVAIAISVMTEEEALWVLAFFAEVLFPDYFGQLVGVVVDNQVLEWMVDALLPTLARHIQDLGLSIPVLATQWLVGVFSDTMPSEAVLQVWAAVLQHGDGRVFLLRVVCALLAEMEPTLLAIDLPQGVMQARSKFVAALYDVAPVLARAEHFEAVLSTQVIRAKRRELKRKFLDELQVRNVQDLVEEIAAVPALREGMVVDMLKQFRAIQPPPASPRSSSFVSGSPRAFPSSAPSHIATPRSRQSLAPSSFSRGPVPSPPSPPTSVAKSSSSSSCQELDLHILIPTVFTPGTSEHHGSETSLDLCSTDPSLDTLPTARSGEILAAVTAKEEGAEEVTRSPSALDQKESEDPQGIDRIVSHRLLPTCNSYASVASDTEDITKELDEEQFTKVMANLHLVEYLDAPLFFALLDSKGNGNGRVDFGELMAGLAVLTEGTWDQRLRLCFDTFDQDRKGHLVAEDVARMLRLPLWRHLCPPPSSPMRRLSGLLHDAISPRHAFTESRRATLNLVFDSKRGSLCESKRNSVCESKRTSVCESKRPSVCDAVSPDPGSITDLPSTLGDSFRGFRLESFAGEILDLDGEASPSSRWNRRRSAGSSEGDIGDRQSLSNSVGTSDFESIDGGYSLDFSGSPSFTRPAVMDKDVLRAFHAMDTTGSGRVTFADFCAAVRGNKRLGLAFERPMQATKRPLWHAKDNRPPLQTSPTCQLCRRPFGLQDRSHSCKACGKAVCAACSPHRRPLVTLGYPKPVRVCTPCSTRDAPRSPSFDSAMLLGVRPPTPTAPILKAPNFLTRRRKSANS